MVCREGANLDHRFEGLQGEKFVQRVLLFLNLTRLNLLWDRAL